MKVKCFVKWVNKLIGTLDKESRAKFVSSALEQIGEDVQKKVNRDENLAQLYSHGLLLKIDICASLCEPNH